MNSSRHYLSGAISSFINAFITIFIALTYDLYSPSITRKIILGGATDILGVFLFIYSFLILIQLLKENYKTYKAFYAIYLLIVARIIFFLMSLSLKMFPSEYAQIHEALLIFLIPLGLTFIFVAYNIFVQKDDTFGLIKGFALALFVAGMCMAGTLLFNKAIYLSNIMGLIALISAVIASVLLGIVFIKAKNGLEFI